MKTYPPYKVLVCEDEEIVRTGLKLIVDKFNNFQVIGEAKNGIEALEKVELLSPDLILMDVGMPQLDGIQATQLIRNRFPAIIVTMMTSHNNPDTVFASLASGAHGYCLKGSSDKKLDSGLNCIMHGDLWVDSELACQLLSFILGFKNSFDYTQQSSCKLTELARPNCPLTTRELDVLLLIIDGDANSEIASKLSISLNTVKTHIKHIFKKLSATDRTQAAITAIKSGYFQ